MKTCIGCGIEKPLRAFNRDAQRKDGRKSYCKLCARKCSKRWRQKHPEQHKANAARWYAEHPKQARTTRARYVKEHRDQVNVWAARWQNAHPEQRRIRARHRRAQRQFVSENFTIEMEQFVHEFWGYQCAVCCTFERLCVDHWLPLSGGHALTTANAVLLCRTCNGSKGARLPETIYARKFVKMVERQLREQAQQWAIYLAVA